jgi:protein-S-isoprenylcysteine O-methyltransferase Ste14
MLLPLIPLPRALLWLVLGSGLRVWSIRTLGAGFSAQYAPVVDRVEHGPYRWLRHPSEVGLVVQALGFTRLCGVSLLWTVLLVGLPALGRVGLEERALRS